MKTGPFLLRQETHHSPTAIGTYTTHAEAGNTPLSNGNRYIYNTRWGYLKDMSLQLLQNFWDFNILSVVELWSPQNERDCQDKTGQEWPFEGDAMFSFSLLNNETTVTLTADLSHQNWFKIQWCYHSAMVERSLHHSPLKISHPPTIKFLLTVDMSVSPSIKTEGFILCVCVCVCVRACVRACVCACMCACVRASVILSYSDCTVWT